MTFASTPTAPPARSGYTPRPVGLAVPGSEPYPWPFDGEVAAGRTALLLVAVQRGLVVRCPQAEAAVAVIGSLTSAVRSWGATVVHTRHAGSPAQRRPSILSPLGDTQWGLLNDPGGDAVVDAFGLDGFAGSPLAERLTGSGIDHLLVCGLGLEGPVHSTMRSANDRGLECLLITDGCAAGDPHLADPALRIVEMSGGIFGAVATSGAVLSALAATGVPGSPHG